MIQLEKRKSGWTVPNLRWWLAVLLFFASVLNYLDRQTLSILAPTMQKDLAITDAQYASSVNLFLVAYTISYVLSGRIVDKLGIRASMMLFVGWWSLANMLTGFARSFACLGGVRFMLGLGEAGNYTVAPKLVSEWFSARERGLAVAIYSLGGTIGATIAPVVVVAIASRWSWQSAFVTTGALGFVWLIPWLMIGDSPTSSKRITQAEADVIADAVAESDAAEPPAEKLTEGQRWRAVLGMRDVWVLMLGRLLTDPVWYFYQFWFAKYLHSARGLTQQQLSVTWVIFLAADIGVLAGGFFSSRLIGKGRQPRAARMAAMMGCACLLPLSPIVAMMPSVVLTLATGMLMVACHQVWLVNLTALVVDRIHDRWLGTAFGVVAAGSTMGGILMNSLVGQLVAHSYTPWFVIMAFLHPSAWLIMRWAGMHKGSTIKYAPVAV